MGAWVKGSMGKKAGKRQTADIGRLHLYLEHLAFALSLSLLPLVFNLKIL